MISHLSGTLVAIEDGAAHVRAGELTYEVLVPAADSMALAARIGQPVSFHTLHYLEGQGQGASFWPRLIGFQAPADRAFFELFTTVKGIGNRKALRAMQVSHGRMAEAIAAGDAKFLATLPEIGKRTAESTIVELKGKLDPFLADPAAARRAEHAASIAAVAALPVGPAADAEEVLVALGEQRPHARAKIERVLAGASGASLSADEIVTRALRTRGVG
jgi:Holliday junction DNA helicase RuvA